MTAEGLDALVAAHAFFAGLAPADIALLAGCAATVHVHAGDVLFRAGDPADSFSIVRAGRIALEKHAPGRDVVRIATASAPDVLGWAWLVPPYRWRVEGRAVESTHALQFDGACLRRKCDADPRLGYTLMQRFAHELAAEADHLRLQLMDVYEH